MNEKLCLFVPTKNRSEFVGRLLSYYHTLQFPGQILLADSSDEPQAARNRQAVKRSQGQLRIRYLHDPALQVEEAFRWASGRVDTAYVVYQGDDDLFIPKGLEACIRFLEANPDYHAANGITGLFKTEMGGPFGKMTFAGRYQAIRGAEAPSAAQRLMNILAYPAVMTFCVHRVESWKKIWSYSTASQAVPYTTELLPSFLCVVQGKVKQLDCLYLMRQAHPHHARHARCLDWLQDERFSQGLVELLARQDGISTDQARQVVRKGFSSFEAEKRPTDGFRRVSRALPPWPKTRQAWRWARSYLPGEQNEFLLMALMRPSSRFHADFLPVHRMVTQGTNGHNP